MRPLSVQKLRRLVASVICVGIVPPACDTPALSPFYGTSVIARTRGDWVVVLTQDRQGRPLRAESVRGYPPDPPHREIRATCEDSDCTTWTWKDPPVGTFYIRASWSDYKTGALCWQVSDMAQRIHRNAGVGLRITLRMEDPVVICL
jgi:hypothetical protein